MGSVLPMFLSIIVRRERGSVLLVFLSIILRRERGSVLPVFLQCRPEISVLRRRKTHAGFLRTLVFK